MKFLRLSVPILAFLLGWEIISRSGWVNAALFPPPSKVALAFVEMARTGEMLHDLRASYIRLLLGLATGSLAGVSVGLLTGRIKFVADALSPLIQLFRPLPPVAIIPLVI